MVLDGISLERLQDRKALLGSFDRFRRDVDSSGAMEGMDAFTEQAFGVLTSSRLADAFDLSKEDPKTVERYGKGTEKLTADGPWKRLDQFLMARRLIEAGARCVTLGFSRWDWHGGNFKRAREDFPLLDQGVSALMQDLVDRGMTKMSPSSCGASSDAPQRSIPKVAAIIGLKYRAPSLAAEE